jgi:hypothetical protein
LKETIKLARFCDGNLSCWENNEKGGGLSPFLEDACKKLLVGWK